MFTNLYQSVLEMWDKLPTWAKYALPIVVLCVVGFGVYKLFSAKKKYRR